MIFLGFLCFPEVCSFFGFQFVIATFALFSFAQRSALLCGAVLLLSGVPTSVLSSYRCPLLLTTFFPFISFSFFPLISQATCLLASFSISPFYLFSHIGPFFRSSLFIGLCSFLTSLVYFPHNSTLQYHSDLVMDDLGPRINFKFSSLKKK